LRFHDAVNARHANVTSAAGLDSRFEHLRGERKIYGVNADSKNVGASHFSLVRFHLLNAPVSLGR
jgi:hypothetical protein